MQPGKHGSPLLFIVSGPAGSGKTTLCDRLLGEFSNIRQVTTATTRPPRPGERDGVDYFFFSQEEFEKKKSRDEFLESANVHGRDYGTLRSEVFRHFRNHADVLLNIDIQGMRQIREKADQFRELRHGLVSIFILPPSLDVLRDRLEKRNADDPEEIERRLQTARKEIQAAPEFDYLLETGEREEDYDRIRSIYLAEQMRQRNPSAGI